MSEPAMILGQDGRRRPREYRTGTAHEDFRRAVAAHRSRGMTMQAIATRLGVSKGTVQNYLREARDLLPGYRPERYLSMRLLDRRGVIWQWTDDAWIASSPHFMQMISDQGEERNFGEVVAIYGFTDSDTPYLRSYEKRDE